MLLLEGTCILWPCLMGIQPADSAGRGQTMQHIICCCEALARQRYNVFGNPSVEPKDIRTASVRDLCLFIRGTVLLNLYWLEYFGLHNKPKAEVHPGHKLTGPKEEEEEELAWVLFINLGLLLCLKTVGCYFLLTRLSHGGGPLNSPPIRATD
jgi:hypothetical protein